jgi:hypothetical protein
VAGSERSSLGEAAGLRENFFAIYGLHFAAVVRSESMLDLRIPSGFHLGHCGFV